MAAPIMPAPTTVMLTDLPEDLIDITSSDYIGRCHYGLVLNEQDWSLSSYFSQVRLYHLATLSDFRFFTFYYGRAFPTSEISVIPAHLAREHIDEVPHGLAQELTFQCAYPDDR